MVFKFNNLKVNGGAIQGVIDDYTPQLGGNLDVNGQSIISLADIDIPITPGSGGNIILDGLIWPQTDGTLSQVLTTDGSGNLSFQGISNSTLTFAETVTISGDGTELSADLTNPVEIFITFSGVSTNGSNVFSFIFSNSSGDITTGLYSATDGANGGATSPNIVIQNSPGSSSQYLGYIHAFKITNQIWQTQHAAINTGNGESSLGGGYMDDGGDTTQFNGAFVANAANVMDNGSWDLYYR